MTDTIDKTDLPTSFGSFKPTGHVMVGVPDVPAAQALRQALLDAGWAPGDVVHFTPRETLEEMQDLVANASPLAGFGAELAMMRRYIEEADRGTRWLLARGEERETLMRLRDLAIAHRARLAVSYRTLVVEDLLG